MEKGRFLGGEEGEGTNVEGEVGVLVEAVLLVRVAGGHEERGVYFEAPGAALDGAGGGEFGEVAG